MNKIYDIYANNYRAFYNQPLGIELEVEYMDLPAPFKSRSWQEKKEGSLRYYGMEYVTAGPIGLEGKKQRLSKLIKHVQAQQFIPDSPRTSVHVHQNVMSYTPIQVWTAVCAYWLFENLLFKYCGKDRENNLFCLRLKDAQNILDVACTDVSNNKVPFYSFVNDRYRYGGINLNAIPKFGSLEFRGMRGVVDVDIMDTWSTELNRLVEVATTQFSDPAHLLDEYFKADKTEFMSRFFSAEFVKELQELGGRYWRNEISDSVGMVIFFAYHNNWELWSKSLDLKNTTKVLEPMAIPPRVRARTDRAINWRNILAEVEVAPEEVPIEEEID